MTDTEEPLPEATPHDLTWQDYCDLIRAFLIQIDALTERIQRLIANNTVALSSRDWSE
jgi:hypothetical protein